MASMPRLAWQALFLDERPYAEVRDGRSPFVRGVGLILLVGVVIALVGLVGTTLEWATSPKLRDIQRTVFDGIQQMDWYQELQRDPETREMFRQGFERGWQILPRIFGAPSIGTAALGIILTPLELLVSWLVYGVVAYIFARLLGGEGGLGQTLGCTALAIGPQLLNLATFFPYVAIGGVVGTWTLLCNYVALKTSHRLTWGRALGATLLPFALLLLLIAALGCLGAAVVAFLIPRGGKDFSFR